MEVKSQRRLFILFVFQVYFTIAKTGKTTRAVFIYNNIHNVFDNIMKVTVDCRFYNCFGYIL